MCRFDCFGMRCRCRARTDTLDWPHSQYSHTTDWLVNTGARLCIHAYLMPPVARATSTCHNATWYDIPRKLAAVVIVTFIFIPFSFIHYHFAFKWIHVRFVCMKPFTRISSSLFARLTARLWWSRSIQFFVSFSETALNETRYNRSIIWNFNSFALRALCSTVVKIFCCVVSHRHQQEKKKNTNKLHSSELSG